MTGPDLELEERLRKLGPSFKNASQPPATLHARVMASTTLPRPSVRRASIVRELSLAAALVVFVGVLAFGFSNLHGLTPAPVKTSPHPTATAIPWTPTPMVLPASSAQQATPAEAATLIGRAVLTVDPLLVPGAVGDDYQAELLATANGFTVDYTSSTRHAAVELTTVVQRIAGPGAHGQRTTRSFRGAEATYQVDDGTPAAARSLAWTEASANRGVPYTLLADGLTETEFWQVANSLHALVGAVQLRPCQASDLRAAAGKASAATGGQLYNSIEFSNHSSTPCRLEGTACLQPGCRRAAQRSREHLGHRRKRHRIFPRRGVRSERQRSQHQCQPVLRSDAAAKLGREEPAGDHAQAPRPRARRPNPRL